MSTTVAYPNARILVVDDAAANVLLLERLLHDAGYTDVSTTTDSRAVLELYREHRYDLILLDLLMPKLDGFEVMEQLKTIEAEGYLPVLVLTAQPAHRLRALQSGAKDFIGKPFDRMEVLTRIHNMLEVRLLLRESRDYGRLLEHFDPLTRLPNRAHFVELLANALAQAKESHARLTVLCVGLDRFKQVNEALGRAAGDAVLRQVAERLTGSLGHGDRLARLGGDEFGMIVATPETERVDTTALAERARAAVCAAVAMAAPDAPVTVTASVGVAPATATAEDAETLIKAAHTALHIAKGAGRDTFRVFDEAMHAQSAHALDLEGALRLALERGEFVLHYQPKMHIATGEWSGLEALLRWERPGHGLMPPGEFIAALEETGLIVPVGAWVIDATCRQLEAWSGSAMGDLGVAVNVSGRQFLQAGFVESVARTAAAHGIPMSLLDIEITESSLLARNGETDRVLRELRALGSRIAVDDFGTGYSSLAYLRRFPIGTLKIDIQFVRDISVEPGGGAIAVAIIAMAQSLGMQVVAEGVETLEQLEFLRAHACDQIQGYYCSRPLPVAALELLRAEHCAGVAAT